MLKDSLVLMSCFVPLVSAQNESTSVIWIGVIVGMLVLCYCLCIICKDPRNLVLCCIDYFDNSEDNGETEDSVGTEDSVETKIIF